MTMLLLALATIIVFSGSTEAAAWPAERAWSPAEEDAFSSWVAEVGVKPRRSVNHLIRDPRHNRLYDPSDLDLYLLADCADLPVVLRAYYAYKRRLPFVLTRVDGGRYSRYGNRTVATLDNLSYPGDAAAFLRMVPNVLHTGTFRTVPAADRSLTYPVAVGPDSIRPGTVFYSPEGHAGIVTEVTPDGDIFLLDGHPDQTVTRTRFSSKLVWKSSAHVGGFKAFRPVTVTGGRARLVTDNRQLPGFSTGQYALTDYYSDVRNRLATRRIDPVDAFEKTIRDDIYAEALDRVQAVDLGWAIGRQRPIAVPPNLYTAVGDWENVSTPSRDMRLRRAFLQLPAQAAAAVRLCRDNPHRLARGVTKNPDRLARALLALKEKRFRQLEITYTNSQGSPVTLSLAELETRLFRLSFDPNHPPELRWGATVPELVTADRSQRRFYAAYESQQPWRNRLTKKHGRMHPADPDNPRTPPPHDLSALIQAATSDAR